MAEAEPGFELHKVPLIVFVMIAAADGQIDEAELLTLQDVFTKRTSYPSPLLMQLLAELPPKFSRLLRMVTDSDVELTVQLQAGLEAVSRQLDEHELHSFRVALLAFGKQVAEASGGGFFGHGDKIDDDERNALAALAAALGLD
jgi:hypothetical protein